MALSVFHSSKLAALSLIAPLYIIPPSAVALTALHFLGYLHLPLLLLAYCVAETVFLVFHTYLSYVIQTKPPIIERDKEQVMKLFNRALSYGLSTDLEGSDLPLLSKEDDSAIQFRAQFASWFFATPFQELKRDDVLKWLAWSLFDSELKSHGEERETCDACLALIERRTAWTFESGSCGAKSIRLTLDPVRIRGRPLVLYIFVYLWNKSCEWSLRSQGFKLVSSTDGLMECLLWIPPTWSPQTSTHRPLVFLHGLGLGFAQYRGLIRQLILPPKSPDADRPLLVPLQPSISMSFFHPRHLKPPSKKEMTDGLFEVISALGWEKTGIDVLSHSMGTIVHGWLLKTQPELIDRSCFVDPVCFCLWEPHVPFNFLYRSPRSGIEILMRYFVARELGIALSLQRYFDWTDNLLWLQDIPNALDPAKTIFFLAGQDGIISTPRVRQYLLERGVSEEAGGGLHLDWEAAHGEALITGRTPGTSGLQKILNWLALDDNVKNSKH